MNCIPGVGGGKGTDGDNSANGNGHPQGIPLHGVSVQVGQILVRELSKLLEKTDWLFIPFFLCNLEKAVGIVQSPRHYVRHIRTTVNNKQY